MPANIPDIKAISTINKKPTYDIFASAHKNLIRQGTRINAQKLQVAQQREGARNQAAQSAANVVNAGRTAYAKNVQTQQKQAQQAQKAHAAGVNSGRVAPNAGAAPRTFAMGTTPAQKQAQKTVQQQRNTAHGQALSEASRRQRQQTSQVNTAHGEAIKFQSAQFKVAQQAQTYAHGQAIQEGKQRAKTVAATAPTTPIAGQHIAGTTFSGQLTPQTSPTNEKNNG